MSVIHVFSEVYMGLSHGGLTELLKQKTGREELRPGQLAVFVNTGWTACKVLAPGNTLLYHREPSGGFITTEDIRRLPLVFGGKRIVMADAQESRLAKAFEAKFGKVMKRLRAVS